MVKKFILNAASPVMLFEKYGVTYDQKWRQRFSMSEKLQLMSNAIANGIYSLEAFFVFFNFDNETPSIELSEIDKQKIEESLVLGFVHYTLNKYMGEVWFNDINPVGIRINDIYNKYIKLNQKDKMKFILTEQIPYKSEDLKEMNALFKKFELEIKIPATDLLNWRDSPSKAI